MLKKMRRRFIFAAMISIFVVMTVLMLAINGVNYTVTTGRLDMTLQAITDTQDDQDSPFQNPGFPKPDPDRNPPQMEGLALFFTVECDSEGEVKEVRDDFFSSISLEDARDYVEAVQKRRGISGYCGRYRYLVTSRDSAVQITFLEAGSELQLMRTLLLVSCAVEIVSLMAVFCLVTFLSRRAIAPYVKNIERQKQFVTDASHEIKTPLTSISTSADVLAMEYEGNEWVENIQKQSVRMSRLVNSLVTLSRLDEERPLAAWSEFNLSDAAWETAEPFSALARAKGKKYEQEIEDGLTMLGDRALIQQMISILLDNAVKYSGEGGTIRLTIRRKHKSMVIEVFNTCDLTGVEDLERLFDRFYRPDQSRNIRTGGTGIGLSIARAVAQAHHGNLSVSSRDKKSIAFRAVI